MSPTTQLTPEAVSLAEQLYKEINPSVTDYVYPMIIYDQMLKWEAEYIWSGKVGTLRDFVMERLNNWSFQKTDLINNPPHYTSHPSGIECIQVTEHMNFNKGNAIKYLWRSSSKGQEIDDLKKAVWYIQREIARIEGSTRPHTEGL